MRMRFAALCAMLLMVACAKPPVQDEVRIDFNDEGTDVVVTADTTFELKPANDAIRRRVDAARASALAHTDAWAVRFANVRPSSDSAFFGRERGQLARVTRTVTIPQDDLQLVFADTNITVKTMRGDGWRELSFYPGTSSRASREQQRAFETELASWSRLVAKYFRATHQLYAYMDRNPGRAKWLFAALLRERNEFGEEPAVLEEEQGLVENVQDAMAEIGDAMDAREDRAGLFAEDADLIYNPFPARVTVRVPGTILDVEGFASTKDKTLVIEPIDLLAMVTALEGRWIAPDPLAALLRDEQLTSAQLAEAERRSALIVNETEIGAELRAKLQRPKAYVVRWRE